MSMTMSASWRLTLCDGVLQGGCRVANWLGRVLNSLCPSSTMGFVFWAAVGEVFVEKFVFGILRATRWWWESHCVTGGSFMRLRERVLDD